ncbi:MAG: 50S ribosomal protein L23 [Bacteroidota bacterium]
MNILKRPIITEKMNKQAAVGRYGFIVDVHHNKIQIKKAVEAMYGVTVDDVRTMRCLGKTSTRQNMNSKSISSGRKSSYKKAIVTLKKGETIDFYSNII